MEIHFSSFKIIVLSLALTLTSITLNAQIELFKDIEPGSGSGFPGTFTQYDGKSYFRADNGEDGAELWVTDGIYEGTYMLKNTNTSNVTNGGDGYPMGFKVFGNKLYFTAWNNSGGRSLWESDGTSSGTKKINNTYSGPSTALPGFTEYNNKLYFSASNNSDGEELWVTDGSTNGAMMLMDINSGDEDAFPYTFKNCNGKLFFGANTEEYGRELWVTDGTPEGTYMVKDIRPGSESGVVGSTSNGNGASWEPFGVLDNKIYFQARDDSHSKELWVSDGTAEGTYMLKDINPGGAQSVPESFFEFNGKLYFRATDNTHGEELWVTDGTEEGTMIVKDIWPGNHHASPSNFTKYNGKLYFNAANGTNGKELWVTDGTSDGTFMVKDINPGSEDGEPRYFTAYNGKLYFAAEDSSGGMNLWVTDGTAEGTHSILHDSFANAQYVMSLSLYNGTLYFTANYDSSLGRELYRYNAPDLSVNNLEGDEKIDVFPNPVTDQLNITSSSKIERLTLSSVTGKTLGTWKNQSSLNLDSVPAGIYFLEIITKKGTSVKKIIKK